MLSVCSLKVCMQNFKKFIYLHITLHFVGIVRATMSLCRQCNVQIGMVGWSRPLMVETWICWNADRYKNNINFWWIHFALSHIFKLKLTCVLAYSHPRTIYKKFNIINELPTLPWRHTYCDWSCRLSLCYTQTYIDPIWVKMNIKWVLKVVLMQ